MSTQDGAQKDVPLAPWPALQPVTPSNLTNLNLTQLLALLQNSIRNQSNIDPSVATLPGSGQNKNTVDSTDETLKENGGSDDEEDELSQDLTQERECQEERGPPIHKKKQKKNYRTSCGVFSRKKNSKR